MNVRSVICAGALALLMAGQPAEGDKANGGNGYHYGWDKGNSGGGVSHSAPGPELGAGLPALLIGGYFWYRRRAKQR